MRQIDVSSQDDSIPSIFIWTVLNHSLAIFSRAFLGILKHSAQGGSALGGKNIKTLAPIKSVIKTSKKSLVSLVGLVSLVSFLYSH